jgi:nitrate reductase NapE
MTDTSLWNVKRSSTLHFNESRQPARDLPGKNKPAVAGVDPARKSQGQQARRLLPSLPGSRLTVGREKNLTGGQGSAGDSPMSLAEERKPERRKETRLFLFLVVCLFPLLSVAIVGGYGFIVWFFQMLYGPPHHKGPWMNNLLGGEL